MQENNNNLMASASASKSASSFNSSPRMVSRSPSSAVVMENSQYRRPGSILSTTSVASKRNRILTEDQPLPRNVVGTLFLSLHVLISMLITFVALAVTVFEILSVSLKSKVSSVPEIPEFVTFTLAVVTLVALFISLKAPTWLLFGSWKTFKKYCFKDNLYLKYSSLTILLVGVISIGIHFWLYFGASTISHITPFFPAGAYLTINALLNLKLHRELFDCGATEPTIMLPYTLDEKNRADMGIEEMSDITGSYIV